MGHSEKLIPMFIPSLASLLLSSEKSKGAALTYEEVIGIRDKGVCMMVPQSVVQKMEKVGATEMSTRKIAGRNGML